MERLETDSEGWRGAGWVAATVWYTDTEADGKTIRKRHLGFVRYEWWKEGCYALVEHPGFATWHKRKADAECFARDAATFYADHAEIGVVALYLHHIRQEQEGYNYLNHVGEA